MLLGQGEAVFGGEGVDAEKVLDLLADLAVSSVDLLVIGQRGAGEGSLLGRHGVLGGLRAELPRHQAGRRNERRLSARLRYREDRSERKVIRPGWFDRSTVESAAQCRVKSCGSSWCGLPLGPL